MSDDLPGWGVYLFGRVTVQDLVNLIVESIVQYFLDLLSVSAMLVFKYIARSSQEPSLEQLTRSFLDFGLPSGASDFVLFEVLDGPAISLSTVSEASLSESSSFRYRFHNSWSTGGGVLSQYPGLGGSTLSALKGIVVFEKVWNMKRMI